MAVNDSSKGTLITDEELRSLLNVTLVGLASYGEVERLYEACQSLELFNRAVPEELRVIHPTASSETIGEFADALRILARLSDEVAE
ncbi:MAG TPA: hypothetical protein VFC24_09850 [Casimicrobiaceae bacterium]|nr:hypothetical protein [Casimicrobiaceae bacterium]